jgi:hypothetical protein
MDSSWPSSARRSLTPQLFRIEQFTVLIMGIFRLKAEDPGSAGVRQNQILVAGEKLSFFRL